MWEAAPETLEKLLMRELGVKRLDVFVREVTFYKNARLVRATYGGAEITYVDVIDPAVLIPLNGDGSAIYLANEYGRVCIDEENVCEYARYFCGNLRARDPRDRFTIVESIGGSVVDGKRQPGDMALTITGRFRSGYKLRGYVIVAGCINQVFLKVHESGRIEMTSDRPVGERATLQ